MTTPKTMQAINLIELPKAYTQAVPITSLVFNSSQPVPIPSGTEHLIRVHATSITPYELSWLVPVPQNPRVPCHDIAGVVISSPSSSQFRPGDRIFGLLPFSHQGGMAEYVTAEEKFLARIPAGVDFVQAASVPRNALTAWQGIKLVEGGLVKKGQSVLVTGATGAAGRMVVQVVRSVVEQGKLVAVGGVGSKALKDLGADFDVNYREEKDWGIVVRSEGLVDVVFDCVGGKTLEKSMELVKDGGLVMTIGTPPPVWEEMKSWAEAEKRGVRKVFFIVSENGEQLRDIARLLENGEIIPSVGFVVDGLREEGVRDGWAKGLKGGIAGSVVVKVL